MFNRKKEYEMLNQMLDDAIAGEFTEKNFDETEYSKLQTKLHRFLIDSSMSEKQLNAEKDNLKELITNISHQTRTPLTNISLYAQLLQEKLTEPATREYVDEIMIHSKKLEVLIESLVKMSRLETGIFQFEKKEESLVGLAESVCSMGKAKAKEKEIAIELSADEDGKVLVDRKWVLEAIYNILDNAIKYSESGKKICVSTFQYEMFSGIRIQDEAGGMTEDEIPQIFGRFYRGPRVHDKEGIGVGLYLSREIIEGQGGYIKVSSELGKGSTFEICLIRRVTEMNS